MLLFADQISTVSSSILYTNTVQITAGTLDVDQCTFFDGDVELPMLSCATGGIMSVAHSTFTQSIISSSNCTLTVEQNLFAETGDGSIAVDGGLVTIENNLISDTGQYPDSVHFNNVAAGSTFRFNTMVDIYTAGERGGTAMFCDSSSSAGEISSNIFAWGDNTHGGTPCDTQYCLYDDPTQMPANVGNLSADLSTMFVSSTDFHLSTSSPAIGRAESNTGVTVDLDGNSRPATNPDIGAYESP